MQLLDGKKVSEEIKNEIALQVQNLVKQGQKVPHLAAVLVGSNGASLTYVGSKVKTCQKIGFKSTLIELPESITEEELLLKIKELNANDDIDGFIVQLPLPKHINEQKILMAIDPDKDVDGFHPTNFGRMALELEAFIPATPYGILQLLDRNNIQTKGKHVVVIGRSNIVGRPMSILMSQKGMAGNATVTLAHSHTQNLNELCQQADIIVTALGVPEFLKAEMVKDGAVIVDVGITRVPDANNPKGYVIKGDVDFENVKNKASWITPVPGGVGPMTIAMLMKNTLFARERRSRK
jgi:methylenetetrahydrofolate dehydrogenase (NADP+) / methenyltetrahydrofolate cyclohydrolase